MRIAPTLTITPFGYLFLPTAIAALIFRRTWLLPLLIVSAGLHAPAVAVIGANAQSRGMGVTPWLVVSIAIAIHAAALVIENRGASFGTTPVIRRLFAGWSAYAAWGIASAFLMSFLFADVPTYNPEVPLTFHTPPSPLEFRAIAAVQAANLAILWIQFFYVLQLPQDGRLGVRLFAGLSIGGLLAAGLSLTQRALLFANVGQVGQYEKTEAPALILESLNPSYVHTLGYVMGSLRRANWPFSEPSYAGTWFAAILAAGLCGLLFSRRPIVMGLLVIAGGLGLANSLSASGGAAAIVSAVLLLAVAAYRLRGSADDKKARIRIFVGILSATITLGSMWTLADRFEATRLVGPTHLYKYHVLPRIEDHKRTGPSRSNANRVAIKVIIESYGLGVGLGGNRASSNLLGMASTMGLPATLLFFGLLIAQSRMLLKHRSRTATGSLVLGGLLGSTLGVVAAIPDVLWPGWWVWILGAFAVIASSTRSSKRIGEFPVHATSPSPPVAVASP